MKRNLLAALAVALVVPLAACGDKPQTAGTKKADARAWEGGQAAYNAPGWKPGDEGSWDAQIRARAQAQNEYARTPSK